MAFLSQGFVAWIVGLLLSQRRSPSRVEVLAEVRSAAGAAATAFIPLVSLIMVVLGRMSLTLALQLS